MIFNNKLPMTKSPRSREELSSLRVTFDTSMFTRAFFYLKSEAKTKFVLIANFFNLSAGAALDRINKFFRAVIILISLISIYYIHKNHFWGTLRLSPSLIDIDFVYLKFRFVEIYYSIRYHLVPQYFWKCLDLNSTDYSDYLGDYLIKNTLSVKTPYPFADYHRLNTSLYSNFLYQSGVGSATNNFISNWSALIIIGSVSIVYYIYEILISTVNNALRMFKIVAKGINYIAQKFVAAASQLSRFPKKAKMYLIDVLGYENRHTFHYSYTSEQLKQDEQVFTEKDRQYPVDSESFKEKLVMFLKKKYQGYGLTFVEDFGYTYIEFKQSVENRIKSLRNMIDIFVWEPLYGIAKHFYPGSSRFMNWVRASSFKLSKKNVFPHLSIYNAEPMAVSSITFRVSGIILSIAILVIFYVKGSEIRVVEELLYYSYITSYTDDVPQGPAFVQRKRFFRPMTEAHLHEKFSLKLFNKPKKQPTKFLGIVPSPDGTDSRYQALIALFLSLPAAAISHYFNNNYTQPLFYGNARYSGTMWNLLDMYKLFIVPHTLSREEMDRIVNLPLGRFPDLVFPPSMDTWIMKEDASLIASALDMYRLCHRDDKKGLHTVFEHDYSRSFRDTLDTWADLPFVPVHWYTILDFFAIAPQRALAMDSHNWRTLLHHFALNNSFLAERHSDGIAMADFYMHKAGQVKPLFTRKYKFSGVEALNSEHGQQMYGVRFSHDIDMLPFCVIKNALRQHIINRINEGADEKELVHTVEGVMTMLFEPTVPRNKYTNRFIGGLHKVLVQTAYRDGYYRMMLLKRYDPELFQAVYDEAQQNGESLHPIFIDYIEAKVHSELCRFEKRTDILRHLKETNFSGESVLRIAAHIHEHIPLISRRDLADYYYVADEFLEFMEETEEPQGHRGNSVRQRHMDRRHAIYRDFLQVPDLDIYGGTALHCIALGIRSWEDIMHRLFLSEFIFYFAPIITGLNLFSHAIEEEAIHWVADLKEYFYPTPTPPNSIYAVPQQILNIRTSRSTALSAHVESTYQMSGIISVFLYSIHSLMEVASSIFDAAIKRFSTLRGELSSLVTSLHMYRNDIDLARLFNVFVEFFGFDALTLHIQVLKSVFFNSTITSWHFVGTFIVLVVASLLLIHCIHAISHFLLDAGFGMEYIRRTGYLFFLYEFIILVACISPVFIGGLNSLDQTFVHDTRSVASYLYGFVPEVQRTILYGQTRTDLARIYSVVTDHPFFADTVEIDYVNKEFKWEFKRQENPYSKKLFALKRVPISIPMYPFTEITDYFRDPFTRSIEGYRPLRRNYSTIVHLLHYYGQARVSLAGYGINIAPVRPQYVTNLVPKSWELEKFNIDLVLKADDGRVISKVTVVDLLHDLELETFGIDFFFVVNDKRVKVANIDFFKIWDNILRFTGCKPKNVADGSTTPMPDNLKNAMHPCAEYAYAFTNNPKRIAVYPYLPFNTWPEPDIDYETPTNYVLDKIEFVEFYAPAVLITMWLSVTFYSNLLFGYIGRGVLFEDPLGDEDSWNEHPHI
jgi:hypothetical protein